MSLRKRAKYPFPEGATYERFINSRVGVIRDVVLHEVLEECGFDVPIDWSRSNYEPDKLFEALDHYTNDLRVRDLGDVDRRGLHEAYQRVRARYAHLRGTLRPLYPEEVTEHLKPSKSAGAPYFRPKSEVMEEAVLEADSILEGLSKPEPCVAYYRTQNRIEEGLANPKVRLVWGYPMAMTILEGMAAVPAIRAVKDLTSQPITSGKTRSEVGSLVASFGWYPVVYSFDWSKFDATVPGFLISWAFNMIKEWFDVDTFPEFEEYWDTVTRYFITAPIVMPDGHIYAGKRSGIPSGSYFTSLIGSLVNLLVIEWMSEESGVPIAKVAVLGDDSIVAYHRAPGLELFGNYALKLGMKLKVVDRNFRRARGRVKGFHYLGHSWNKGRPVRPLEETLQRIVFHEKDNRIAVEQVGIKTYRFEKLLALYADNVEAYLLIRYLVYHLLLGKMSNLELGKKVRHRGDFLNWD